MENQKNNKGVISLLILIILILSALCVLFATGTISFNTNKTNNDVNENINDNKQNDEKEENTDNTKENEENGNNNNAEVNEVGNLGEYWLVNDVVLTQEKTTNLTFKITDNGKISINNSKSIDNIANAKNIKLFSPPSPYSILYILTKDGNLYKYETSEYEKGNYTATKMDNYSNVEKIVTYQKRSIELKGGCDYIFVADKNGKHYELDSFCI